MHDLLAAKDILDTALDEAEKKKLNKKFLISNREYVFHFF